MTYKPSPELLAAVRRFAEAQMSAAEIASELTTPARPLTRNAIIGVAHRNGIKLPPKTRPSGPRKPKDKHVITHTPQRMQPTFGTIARNVRAPRAGCSWAGCEAHAVEGDMFCYQHHRKQLVQS